MIIPWPVGKADRDAHTSSQNVDYIKGLISCLISHIVIKLYLFFAQFLMFRAFFLKLLLLQSFKKGGIFSVRFDP